MTNTIRGAVALTALACLLGSASAVAKEFILTAVKPDKVVLADPATREVVKTHRVPDAGAGIATVTPSPDGRIAYVLTNHWESVSGIDLDTGEEVFRADFSGDGMRVKGLLGMDISPDGKELYVMHSPVELLRDEYRVQDVYVGVYRTDAGLDAKPVRRLEVPRRTVILVMSNDGSKLYALSWDIEIFDPKTGEHLGTHPLRSWERLNYSEPDVLDVWPQWEQADMFSTPYYAVRTDKDPADPAAYKTGLATLDLETGEFTIRDFEDTAAVIFSTVMNPKRRNEVYGVYTQLSKIDAEKGELIARKDLEHTYYAINVSGDGEELYVGGTMDDIAVYDTRTLEKLGAIRIPGGGDMGIASMRMIDR